jgi:hypothetical protein
VAWTFSDGTNVSQSSVLAGIHYDDLSGSYTMPAALSPNLRWLTFRIALFGGDETPGNGNVGAWPEALANDVTHDIFPGGAALAAYPVAP